MSYQFRPAVRTNTPLIIGLAGPTKSGKTMSALRLATGMANGGIIAMINAEGPRGHQYADKFEYVACELTAPYRPDKYTEALEAAKAANPAVIIIDSISHCHDGPGGILEWHEEILDKIAGNDYKQREKSTFVAWVKPKASENQLIYTMLEMKCPVILCMRAKEKIKIVTGKPIIDLGWQPIVGERIAFETIFTLMFVPHSKGVPELELSDMREPFDTLVPKGKPIDEALGKLLAEWSAGGRSKHFTAPAQTTNGQQKMSEGETASQEQLNIAQDPSEPYKAKLYTCERTKQAITDTYNAIPDYIRQDCFQEYQKQLRSLDYKPATV